MQALRHVLLPNPSTFRMRYNIATMYKDSFKDFIKVKEMYRRVLIGP